MHWPNTTYPVVKNRPMIVRSMTHGTLSLTLDSFSFLCLSSNTFANCFFSSSSEEFYNNDNNTITVKHNTRIITSSSTGMGTVCVHTTMYHYVVHPDLQTYSIPRYTWPRKKGFKWFICRCTCVIINLPLSRFEVDSLTFQDVTSIHPPSLSPVRMCEREREWCVCACVLWMHTHIHICMHDKEM